jgi:lipid-A-disaccharide synthase
MNYYLIAGEASGDLHGSNLIREIKKLDGIANIRCWGGDMMEEQGATLVKHYRDLAFMGFIEVVRNLRTIFTNLKFCKEDILAFKPDAVILIDYPGFNMRIAAWAKKHNIPVIYYISPQIWAWKENRVKQIRVTVDKMLVILPFEKAFYKKWNFEVEYVGHPLVDVIEQKMSEAQTPTTQVSPLQDEHIVAILPGSRKQEVLKKLPVMLEASRHFPDYRFIVAKASSLPDEFYQPFLTAFPQMRTIRNNTYSLLMQAKAAIVTSGTATLETALFGVPQVVCYKGSALSYQIAKRLIKVKYISLVNLIMNKPVVKELIQGEMNAGNIRIELLRILQDDIRILEIRKDYAALKQLLSEGGNASQKAAKSIVEFMKSRVNAGTRRTSTA